MAKLVLFVYFHTFLLFFLREMLVWERIQNKVGADEAARQVKCVWMFAHYLQNMSPTLLSQTRPWKYACCPPSSQCCPMSTLLPGFTSAVFELGRGHICKELCPRDLFISHLSVWGGALARTKWHRGYKCLQLKPKSKEVNNMTWSKLYFQKQNTSQASISKIWNFITLAYFRDDEMMSFLCFFSLIFASKSLIH